MNPTLFGLITDLGILSSLFPILKRISAGPHDGAARQCRCMPSLLSYVDCYVCFPRFASC